MNDPNFKEQNIQSEKLSKIIYILKFALLSLAYGFNGTCFTSIPFLFLSNTLDCLNEKGQSYQCSEEEACSNKYGYIQEEQLQYPSIYSITMFLNIYCDRKIIKAWILTLGTLGKIVGNIFLIFYKFNRIEKEHFINAVFIMIGVFLCLLYWVQETFMFFISFFIWHLGFTLFFGTQYTHILESFPDFISKYGAGILNTFWPTMMVLYNFYTLFYGSWEDTVIYITGIPVLIIGILRLLLSYLNISPVQKLNSEDLNNKSLELIDESVKQIEHENRSKLSKTYLSNQNSFDDQQKRVDNQNQYVSNLSNLHPNHNISICDQYFPFLNEGDVVRRNFFIWSFGWACNCACYVGCFIQLDTLKGDLFFNNFFFTIIEVVASFVALLVIVRFQDSLKQFSIAIYIITGLAFLSSSLVNKLGHFYTEGNQNFDTISEKLLQYLLIFFSLLPVIVAKISYEMMWTVLITYQKFTIPIRYQQSSFACSALLGSVAFNLVPFYIYFSERLGMNPFIGFGLLCFISAYYTRQFEEIQAEDQDKQKKEDQFKIKETN